MLGFASKNNQGREVKGVESRFREVTIGTDHENSTNQGKK